MARVVRSRFPPAAPPAVVAGAAVGWRRTDPERLAEFGGEVAPSSGRNNLRSVLDGGGRHAVPHWPMIEMGWSRKDCLTYLKDKLPHETPKSSCVFCPDRTNQSWTH